MTRLTDDAIAAIRAREDEATIGPWTAKGVSFTVGFCHGADDESTPRSLAIGRANAAFIAAARTDVPALLAHADALAAKLAEVERERDAFAAKLAVATTESDVAKAFHDVAVRQRDARAYEADAALAEQRRLAGEVEVVREAMRQAQSTATRRGAEIERMRPVVRDALSWRDCPRGHDGECGCAIDLAAAITAYRAAPQPLAVEPCKACQHRRAAGFDGQCPACAGERARDEMAAERARAAPQPPAVDCADSNCQREAGHDGPHMSRSFDAQANTEVVDEWPNNLASAIRALPDEEPLSEEELDDLNRLQPYELDGRSYSWVLDVVQGISRAVAEIRAHRAAALSDDDKQRLSFVRHVLLKHDEEHAGWPDSAERRAIAVLDRLLSQK